ncbi:hypothetical protein BVRB_4g078550 [Beta vulgaris subsp. vulgaris]|nr:hypothetical protein BVRB_4g078550 [Beta vulgaris subsp. vulgaris]
MKICRENGDVAPSSSSSSAVAAPLLLLLHLLPPPPCCVDGGRSREKDPTGGSHCCRGERNRSQLHGLVFVVGRSKMPLMWNEEEGESERKAEVSVYFF